MTPELATTSLLGDRSPAQFLDDYWQKKPLVVRDALPDFQSPISPEELAGLACEEGVTSRLILEKGGAEPWELREGPFEEEEFLNLPETHWTLLVQEVDRLIPEVGALLNRFRFLPRWRIDDIMVSYAPTGGNVGAHIDNYDVFLLQGQGHRRWHFGHEPVEDEEIVPDLDVRILADFTPDETVDLGPGDMLYLPPRVAHHGVALDDACMTYSVGFRAPSHKDLLLDFMQYAAERVDPEARYEDPDLDPADHPGAIRSAARERVRTIVQSALDEADLDRWFGTHVTALDRGAAPIPPETPWSADELTEAIEEGAALRHGPASRFAFTAHENGTATLFVDGRAIDLASDQADLAPALADQVTVPAEALQPHLNNDAADLLVELVNEGALEVVPSAEPTGQ